MTDVLLIWPIAAAVGKFRAVLFRCSPLLLVCTNVPRVVVLLLMGYIGD